MTAEEIEAARTPNGGWTRATLAEWGVPWPPPKGWKLALLAPVDTRRMAETENTGSVRSTGSAVPQAGAQTS